MSEQDWFQTSQERRQAFLSKELTGRFQLAEITSDMAPRHYHRITQDKKSYILMECAPDGHKQALVGHEISAFLNVQKLLSAARIKVPKLYAVDEQNGLLLLEDFGDITFEKALLNISQNDKEDLYSRATNMLFDLKAIPQDVARTLPVFRDSRIYQFGRRFADWFLPYYFDRPVSDDDIAGYFSMMKQIEADLPEIPFGFVHGDFQPPNMMVLPDGQIGLLDFQGAMYGPPVYDLVNLLHDARRHVDPKIIRDCKDAYVLDKKNDVMLWYNYISLHFHLRVIGQFIRVAYTLNKTSYLIHLNRLWGYLGQNENKVFQDYAQNIGLDFSKPLPPFDLERLKKHVRSDAT